MSVERISRDELYTAVRELDDAFQAVFPEGGPEHVLWQFSPHQSWERVNKVYRDVTWSHDISINGDPPDESYYILEEEYDGHEVRRKYRYWRFIAGPRREALLPMLAQVPHLTPLRKRLRCCLRLARQIEPRLIRATAEEVQFVATMRNIEWARWAVEPKLRRLRVMAWSPVPSNGRLFTPVGPTHEATVSPPSFAGLARLRQLLAPSQAHRVGRPRKECLEAYWEEAQELFKKLGTWAKAVREFNKSHGTRYSRETIQSWGRYLRKRDLQSGESSSGES